MSQIRIVFDSEEAAKVAGPATDQHPDARRYYVAGKVVDAIGEPTEAEVMAVLNPPAQPSKEAAIDALLQRMAKDADATQAEKDYAEARK